MNSDLSPDKILDIQANANKMNREKDENNHINFEILKSDEKKLNDVKHSSENVDGIVKLDEKMWSMYKNQSQSLETGILSPQ